MMMMYRKQGITALSIFKLYYKILSIYKPNNFSDYVWKRTKEIQNKQIEYQIENFLKDKFSVFNDSLSEIEDYFKYCFTKEHTIYFPNLGQYIPIWQKDRVKGHYVNERYRFADIIIKH